MLTEKEHINTKQVLITIYLYEKIQYAGNFVLLNKNAQAEINSRFTAVTKCVMLP